MSGQKKGAQPPSEDRFEQFQCLFKDFVREHLPESTVSENAVSFDIRGDVPFPGNMGATAVMIAVFDATRLENASTQERETAVKVMMYGLRYAAKMKKHQTFNLLKDGMVIGDLNGGSEAKDGGPQKKDQSPEDRQRLVINVDYIRFREGFDFLRSALALKLETKAKSEITKGLNGGRIGRGIDAVNKIYLRFGMEPLNAYEKTKELYAAEARKLFGRDGISPKIAERASHKLDAIKRRAKKEQARPSL